MKTTTPLGFFLLCFLTCVNLAQAQLSCGTEVDKARMEADALQNQALSQNQRGLFFPVNCLGKKLSITAYIFRDSLGADGISQATIQSAVQTMNNDFSPMCLSFDVCKYVYVNNYNYNDFKGVVHEDEVYNLYYTPNTINIYFVKSLISKSGSAVCGYAYMPGGRDMIFLQKSCVGDGKTFSHEMRHFFGLYHTFETSNGVELDITTNFLKGLSVIAGYSYNDMHYTKTPGTKGSYVTGERLVNTPAHTANASAFYTFSRGGLAGLKLGAAIFYVGDRFGGWNNTIEQTQNYSRLIPVDGFTTIDLSAGYSIKRFSLLAKVSNLTNTYNYYVHENYSINPIPPTQFVATVAYKF